MCIITGVLFCWQDTVTHLASPFHGLWLLLCFPWHIHFLSEDAYLSRRQLFYFAFSFNRQYFSVIVCSETLPCPVSLCTYFYRRYCLSFIFLGHISLFVLYILSLFYSPSPAVISDSSVHWHFLCFFWTPLHFLIRSLLSLSNTRSGFFCLLFPPLVLIYHLFRYITFQFSVRTPIQSFKSFLLFPSHSPTCRIFYSPAVAQLS